MQRHVTPVNSLSFHYVNIPLFSHTSFLQMDNQLFPGFLLLKTMSHEHFLYVSRSKISQDLAQMENSQVVKNTHFQFCQKIPNVFPNWLCQFMFVPFVYKGFHFLMFLLTFRMTGFKMFANLVGELWYPIIIIFLFSRLFFFNENLMNPKYYSTPSFNSYQLRSKLISTMTLLIPSFPDLLKQIPGIIVFLYI